MKHAAFTVQATADHPERWRRAATAEGFLNIGLWLGAAADRWLKVQDRPLSLAWRRGSFRVVLAGNREAALPGYVSQPFGIYCGTDTSASAFEDDVGYSTSLSWPALAFEPPARISGSLREWS